MEQENRLAIFFTQKMDNIPNVNSKKNFDTEPSPRFQLVGNFLPEIIKQEFPPKPPLKFVDGSVVQNHVCVSTKGTGRIFLPVTLINRLSIDENVDEYEIIAAPGIPRNRYEPNATLNAHTRTEMSEISEGYFRWYHRYLAEAMKPIDDYIPENCKLFSTNITFILTPTWNHIYNLTKLEIEADVILRQTDIAQTNADVGALSTENQ
ncbi:uncharacterized protein LOC119072896 [Bradysia coprophila]|uniref:uncharacterized protein LOC119072896 n=1 Tax=Bradysia coprophila TaxID=38358 RepID=UPI00187DC2FF|nr:uncharacterized protein LOC119072896 [Bradysia coprophila]